MSRHYIGLYNPLKPHTTFVMRLYAFGDFTNTILVKNNELVMLEWATKIDTGVVVKKSLKLAYKDMKYTY